MDIIKARILVLVLAIALLLASPGYTPLFWAAMAVMGVYVILRYTTRGKE